MAKFVYPDVALSELARKLEDNGLYDKENAKKSCTPAPRYL